MSLQLNEEIYIKTEPFEEQDTEVDNNETFGQNTTLSGNEMDVDNIEIGVEEVTPFEIIEVKTETVTDNSLTCGKCNENFSSNEALQLHKINFHDKDIKCSICNEIFTNRTFKAHLSTHAEKSEKTLFTCSLCSSKYTTIYHLKTHLLTIHNLDGISVASLLPARYNKTHKCKLCPFTFVTKKDLSLHMNSLHRKTTSRPYKCNDCGACFTEKRHLNEHSTIHTGEKPYKCSICSRDFRLKSILNKHLIRVHKIAVTADLVQKQPTVVPVIIDQKEHTVCEMFNIQFSSHENLGQHVCTIQDNVKIETFEEQDTEIDSNETFDDPLLELDNEFNEEIHIKSETFEEHDTEVDGNETFGQNTSLSGNEMNTDNIEIGVEDVKPFDIFEMETESLLAEPVTDNLLMSQPSLDDHLLAHLPRSNILEDAADKIVPNKEPAIIVQKEHKVCEKCNAQLSLRKNRKQHLCAIQNNVEIDSEDVKPFEFVKVKTEPVTCGKCNEEFSSLENLQQHEQSIHENIKCSICNESFNGHSNLKHHLLIHTKVKHYQCSLCSLKFALKIQLKNHLQQNHKLRKSKIFRMLLLLKEKQKSYPCEKCDAIFQTWKQLSHHIKSFHQGLKTLKSFQCSICDKSFTSKPGLTSHLALHSGEKPFQCSVCEQDFSYRKSLKLHLLKVHELKVTRNMIHNKASPTPIVIDLKEHTVCKICNIEFGSIENLNQHMCTIHGNVAFKCTKCSASFNDQASLNCHLQIHTVIKKIFTCVLCNRNLKAKDSLRRHLLNKHKLNKNDEPVKSLLRPPPKLNNFIVCGPRNTYESKQGVTIQKRQFKQRLQQFQCNICSKRCTTQAGLNLHVTLHSGKKPFKCPICGRDFRLKNGLREHLCTVHGLSDVSILKNLLLKSLEKPSIDKIHDIESNSNSIQQNVNIEHKDVRQFKCSTCHEDFTSRTSLIGHLRTHDENTELNLISGLQHSPPKLHHSMTRNKVRQTDCKLTASSLPEITKVKSCCVLLDRGEVTRYLSRLDKREVTEERGSPIEGLPPPLATPAPPVRDDPRHPCGAVSVTSDLLLGAATSTLENVRQEENYFK